MLVIGVDDAGRGPAIGPMVLGGVLMEKDGEEKLRELGVKDSKMIFPRKRRQLTKEIKELSNNTKTVVMTAEEINEYMDKNINLNTIEAIAAAQVINYLVKDLPKNVEVTVYLDCPSVNTKAWLERVGEFLISKERLRMVCEHKADVNYIVVGAASIMAKVKRDEEVQKLKKELGIDFGSGYPSDPKTKEFLKEHYKTLKEKKIFREHWATIKNLDKWNKDRQRTLL